MDIAQRAALSTLIFIVVCLSGLFTFWIGGGQPFTPAAGECSAFVLVVGGVCSVCAWVYSDPRDQ